MAPKDILTKEFLEEHFIRQGKSVKRIAEECGLRSSNSVTQYIKKFGLKRDPIRNSRIYLTKEFLEDRYVKQQMTLKEIAAEVGTKCRATIKRYLKKYGIPIRVDFISSKLRRADWGRRRRGVGEISAKYWMSIVYAARSRELPIEVTLEDIWKLFLDQERKCALTGEELRFPAPGEPSRTQTASLDRIDSEKGYIPGNLQWIHKRLQRMKNATKNDDFVRTCRTIATYRQDIL